MSSSSFSSSERVDRRVMGFEAGPSSSSRSRRRGGNSVWPGPFVEALAYQVAVDAVTTNGRLAAAPVLASLFQVCSTWQAVSRSNLLWHNLTARIWNRRHLLHDSWRHEFIFWHQTANNFRMGRYIYSTLHFVPPTNGSNDGLSCRRLSLSDHHLAAGFSDGSVRLFYIPTRLHLSTFHPHHRDPPRSVLLRRVGDNFNGLEARLCLPRWRRSCGGHRRSRAAASSPSWRCGQRRNFG
ncbi:unnamed protein product [Cuscuta epithymum]|uniref:Uncharacterized protein n=1 Tax=Cuscuta epithymum TaxID=186058 RepID=A0AAV0FJP6_9ASTE|nr:unnamed protein product [Cuscuta epithymum]